MCGILLSTSDRVTERDFRIALDTMTYRGPNASGVLSHQNLKLGQRRLSIVDLDDRANQPFLSADGRYAISFNGEIYNYRELIRKHEIPMRTHCDTEVLLQMFIRFGSRMLDELNGMFAFVIVDLTNGQWFAARDRLGVKPLYMAHFGGGLLLGSEPAPLLHIIGRADFDEEGRRQYLKLRTFFNGRTIWKGLQQFPAGHFMTSDDPVPRRWWALPHGPKDPPSDDELRALIEDAVNIRRVADVQVGSYLSGGLDSTIVAGLADKPHTWTVGFPDENEFSYARIAAERFGSEHHETLIGYENFTGLADMMVRIRCEPLSVPNEVLLYAMTREVAAVNTVVLSGEGADELFFGYDRIFRWASTHSWDLAEFSKIYAYGSGDDLEIVEAAVEPYLASGNALAIVAAFFQEAHLHGLLRRLDSATMLCSVEARGPFLDYRLVERMAGVPFAWRMQDGIVKAPLKRVFADILPRAIVDRPKIGFPVPLARIAFPAQTSGSTPFDRWLNFNLEILSGECGQKERSLCA